MSKVNYFNPISENGVTYSVDMVRYKLVFFYGGAEELGKYLMANTNIKCEQHICTSFMKYHDLFVVELDEDVTFSLGIGWNFTGKCDYSLGFIEFNPNKCCNYEFFEKFFTMLRIRCKSVMISRWDFAVDIPVERSKVKLHKDTRTYERVERGTVTEYLGTRNQNGRFKLYDKKHESKLDYDLTRAELTLDGYPCFEELQRLFPRIDFFKEQYEMDMLLKLSQNDLVLLKLLLASPDFDLYFNQLSRRKRERLEPYLFDSDKSLKISRKCYNHCIDFVHSFEKTRIMK